VNHSLRNAIVLEFDIFANNYLMERADRGLVSQSHIAWVIPSRMRNLGTDVSTGGGRHHDPGVDRNGIQLGNVTHTGANEMVNNALVYSHHLVSRRWRPFSFEWQPRPTLENPYGGRMIVETQIISSAGVVVRNLIDEDRGGEGALIYDIDNYRTFFNLAPGQNEVYWGFTGCTGAVNSLQAMAFTHIVGLKPYIDGSKDILNSEGVSITHQQVRRGDILTYRINLTNQTDVREHMRNLAYTEIYVTDVLPRGVSYLPGSGRIVKENGAPVEGDVSFDPVGNTITAYIPRVLSGEKMSVYFDVQVNNADHGTIIFNQAILEGRNLFRGYSFNDNWSRMVTNFTLNIIYNPEPVGSIHLQVPETIDFGTHLISTEEWQELPIVAQRGGRLGVNASGDFIGRPWALQVVLREPLRHNSSNTEMPLLFRDDEGDTPLNVGHPVTVHRMNAVDGFFSIFDTWYSSGAINRGLYAKPSMDTVREGRYTGVLEWVFWPDGLPEW